MEQTIDIIDYHLHIMFSQVSVNMEQTIDIIDYHLHIMFS